MRVSSVPLSLTIDSGLPRVAIRRSSSRGLPQARERGGGDGRQACSRRRRIRKRRPPTNRSETKSRDQRSFGAKGAGIGARVPRALLRPALLAHHEPFLRVDAEKPFVVHGESFPWQEDEQTPVAAAPALACQCAQALVTHAAKKIESRLVSHNRAHANRRARAIALAASTRFTRSDSAKQEWSE